MSEPGPGSWREAQTALRGWYDTALGRDLHARVAGRAEAMLRNLYALHCLQVGGTRLGVDLLAGRALIHHIHLTGDGADGIRAEPTLLPLETRSLDLVVLCHALEFCDDPHTLLREVDRVLKLDGHVLAIGFNPWSLFGLTRLLHRSSVPWSGHFYSPRRVADWMALLGLRIQQRATVWLRPPAQRDGLRRYLAPCERMHAVLGGAGGVYFLLGRKHSVPFTPVGLGWERHPEAVAPGRIAHPTRKSGAEPLTE